MPLLKICGYRTPLPPDAFDGVDFVGINFVPTSKRYIYSSQLPLLRGEGRGEVKKNIIHHLLHHLPPHIQTVAVVQNMPLEELVQLQETYHFDFLQLHGDESVEYAQSLKNRRYKIIKACTYENYAHYEHYPCDFLLIDAKSPGSGMSYDYSQIRCSRPFFLAGGLHIGNIREALKIPHLYALDIASGVETDGVISVEKIAEIVGKIRVETG